jgi:hypothetical protein
VHDGTACPRDRSSPSIWAGARVSRSTHPLAHTVARTSPRHTGLPGQQFGGERSRAVVGRGVIGRPRMATDTLLQRAVRSPVLDRRTAMSPGDGRRSPGWLRRQHGPSPRGPTSGMSGSHRSRPGVPSGYEARLLLRNGLGQLPAPLHGHQHPARPDPSSAGGSRGVAPRCSWVGGWCRWKRCRGRAISDEIVPFQLNSTMRKVSRPLLLMMTLCRRWRCGLRRRPTGGATGHVLPLRPFGR